MIVQSVPRQRQGGYNEAAPPLLIGEMLREKISPTRRPVSTIHYDDQYWHFHDELTGARQAALCRAIMSGPAATRVWHRPSGA